MGLIPDSGDVRDWARVWLAFLEASARDRAVADCVAVGRSTEHALISARFGPRAADGVHALVEGLRWRVASDEDLPAGRAAAALASTLARIDSDGPLRRLA